MTFYEAAVEILRQAGKPLPVKKITELAVRLNLLSHVGKTPELTMQARLAAEARKDAKTLLVRTKPGVFGLRDFARPADAPPPLPGLQEMLKEDGGGGARAEGAGAERAERPERAPGDKGRGRGRGEAAGDGAGSERSGGRRRRRGRGGEGHEAGAAERAGAGAGAAAGSDAGAATAAAAASVEAAGAAPEGSTDDLDAGWDDLTGGADEGDDADHGDHAGLATAGEEPAGGEEAGELAGVDQDHQADHLPAGYAAADGTLAAEGDDAADDDHGGGYDPGADHEEGGYQEASGDGLEDEADGGQVAPEERQTPGGPILGASSDDEHGEASDDARSASGPDARAEAESQGQGQADDDDDGGKKGGVRQVGVRRAASAPRLDRGEWVPWALRAVGVDSAEPVDDPVSMALPDEATEPGAVHKEAPGPRIHRHDRHQRNDRSERIVERIEQAAEARERPDASAGPAPDAVARAKAAFPAGAEPMPSTAYDRDRQRERDRQSQRQRDRDTREVKPVGSAVPTLADAAYELLRTSQDKRPLHFRQLTEMAQKRRLIRLGTQQPWTAMATALTLDAQRRLDSGQRPRFRQHAGGLFSLVEWRLDPEGVKREARVLEAVAEQERHVRSQVEGFIDALSPAGFEHLAVLIMECLGVREVQSRERMQGMALYSGQRDGQKIAAAIVPGQGALGRRLVTELRSFGTRLGEPVECWLLAAGGPADEARAEAGRGGPPVTIMEGAAMARAACQHGLGVMRARIEVDYADPDFFAELG